METKSLIPNNSAGRLHRILERLLKQNERTTARDAWADVLECKDSSRSELLRLIGLTIGLPDIVAQDVEKLDGVSASPFLSWKDDTDKAFSTLNLDAQIKQVRDRIGKETLRPLAIVAEMLSAKEKNSGVDKTDINNIRNDIDTLQSTIQSSELSDKAKNLMLRKLDELDRALNEAVISGASGLQRATESAVGGFALHKDIYDEIKDTEEANQFWTIVSRVADLIQIGTFLLLLAQSSGLNILPEAGRIDNDDMTIVEDNSN